MNRDTSKKLYREAGKLIPGGVNSPVRSGRAVRTDPLFIREAKGCRITDEDGNSYIDYVGSWGPLILGHAHPAVVGVLREVADRGTSYGIPTRIEIEMAAKVVEMVPSVEMVRMVNSGTEATMSAVRLARGIYGAQKNPEIQRLLPRSCGFTSGTIWFRAPYFRYSGYPRCSRGNGPAHTLRFPITTWKRSGR